MFNQIHIPAEVVHDLDEQLSQLGAIAHVAADRGESPSLVAIAQGFSTPLPLTHPRIETFIEAELIAARVNALQGAGDRQRIVILRSMNTGEL
ncbi:hypothetical protein [Pseudomonas sp.]|jgi:hypothetical protein|uniref:hypothetical protein n=1 Tax=Pseudomonas sp. TaxID=306 RepID=UPI001D2C4953|nr:hypothetical protein [Pseudomonas sp.]MBW4652485.1 hypothetical protein [Kaiparowitsia implicata GSE-PSE-MK54-09C]HUE91857.1 hypothetical protein [Pseudomonas sp.]